MSTPPQRSVKIPENERTGWSSERPRRPGEPERPPRKADVSASCRVMAPSDRIRYSPGSLVVVASADHEAAEALCGRVLDDRGALLSAQKVRSLIEGKVADDELEDKARALLDAAVGKRLEAGQAVVVVLEGLESADRERYVRMAAPHRRPRHVVLVEVPRDDVPEDERPVLNDLRAAVDGGGMGGEGFFTSLRLGGSAITDLRKIVFAPPPKD